MVNVGVSSEEAVVEDVSSDSSWNGVSCRAQVCPSRPSCHAGTACEALNWFVCSHTVT